MPNKGEVILVGAGPGDPGLLTLAGKDALETADVVLYDRLIGEAILALLPPGAETIDVGKTKGSHPVPQDEINRLLVHHARAGKKVVRLKGGDPYLFGRGAEELEQVAQAGIPFRVVPGVTSAIAAPACAGIPVTHRAYASSLHILTGHGKNGDQPDIPYHELAKLLGTLVFLMGLAAIEDICRGLIFAGMPMDTPAALVENGTQPTQRRLSGTLATLPELARAEAAASPATLIIGQVCQLAATLDWTTRLPLRDRKILTVASRTTGARLTGLLRHAGCAVDEFAGIRTEALPIAPTFWQSLNRFNWIVFTSQTGVDCFFDGFFAQGGDMRSLAANRFAVVGNRTGEALSQRGITPDYMPEEYNGQALGKGLAERAAPGATVLLFRAERGGDALPDILRTNHLACEDVAAYRTIENALPPTIAEKLRTRHYDAATFTSASAVDAFAKAAPEGSAQTLPAYCIGEMTAAAARKRGMTAIISPEASIAAMASLITEKMGKA